MRKWTLILFLMAASCGGDDDPVIDAPPATPDALPSICGEPGDTGNELGVGEYCDTSAECAGNTEATICATLGNPQAHFCTTICDMTDPTVDCGTGASCQCQDGACACTPDSCL